MPKTYGYLKTNVDVKDLMPQIEILKPHGVTDQNLFSDPIVAGKTYPGLNALIGKLRRKDTLVILTMAALGSSLDEILATWNAITSKGANIFVLDMPAFDTRITDTTALGKPIADIAIQIFAYANDTNKSIARLRQAEGIAKAQARGTQFGQKRIPRPTNYEAVRDSYLSGEINRGEASKKLGISKGTFDRWLKQDRESGSAPLAD